MASQPSPLSRQPFQERPDPFAGSRYRAVSRLASSETGDAYVVEHLELKKRFAAKLLRAEVMQDPHVVDRMRLEAQSLGRLRHPNVVGITGFERTTQGAPFIVMELLRGRTLDEELIARGALPVDEAVDWTRQILSALEATHDIGIIHRDINPKNLVLHALPSGQRILKVLDFGAARVLSGASSRAPKPLAIPTREGVIVGTPKFASPEEEQGQTIDPRSDLYQVGLVLYVMLAGRWPFDPLATCPGSEDPTPAARALASELPKPPSVYRSGDLAANVDAVVLHALAKHPDDRFQTASEFRRALEELRTAPIVPAADDFAITLRTQTKSTTLPLAGTLSNAARWLLFLALSTVTAIAIVTVGLFLARWR